MLNFAPTVHGPGDLGAAVAQVFRSLRSDRFVRNLASMGGAQLAQRVSRLVAAIALSARLDAESFGLAAIVLTAYELVSLFTRNGMSAKITQASAETVERVAQTAYWMNWAVCAALMFLQAGIALPLSWLYQDSRLALPIALMSLIYLAAPLSNVQAGFIQREGRIERFALASATQVTADNLLTAALVLAGFGWWSIIWPKILVAPIWVMFLRTGHPWRAAPFPGLKQAFVGGREIARFSLSVVGVELLTAAQANLDNLIVGYFLGIEALGVYYFAFNAGLGLSLGLIGAFSTATFSHLCQANSDARGLAARFRRARRVTGMIVVPLVLVQALAAPLYVPLVFGAKWTPAVPVLMAICLSALVRPFAAATSQLLRAMNRPQVELRWQLALTVVLALALLAAAQVSILAVGFAVLIVQTLVLGAFSLAIPRMLFAEERASEPATRAPADVLIVAFEAGRWGPARLPAEFTKAGLRVSALTPADNALAHTRHLTRHYVLDRIRSRGGFARRLAQALRDAAPRLVIPGDEQTVAMLHAIIAAARRGERSALDSDMISLLTRSLGDPERYQCALFKDRTLKLAHACGVRAPLSVTVGDAREATAAAETIGFPVYLKQTFSWAGRGVHFCRDADALAAAFQNIERWRLGGLRNLARRLLGRDWFPTTAVCDVQQAIDGEPASYNVAALNGKVIAGCALRKVVRKPGTGPSTVVWMGAHAEMASAAEMLVRVLGANGLLSFDFMIEQTTGHAYLIECNPRPTPTMHAAPHVGVDLCGALAAGLRGDATPGPSRPNRETVLPLFPQEWLRRNGSVEDVAHYGDAPLDDPSLMGFIFSAARRTTLAVVVDSR